MSLGGYDALALLENQESQGIQGDAPHASPPKPRRSLGDVSYADNYLNSLKDLKHMVYFFASVNVIVIGTIIIR